MATFKKYHKIHRLGKDETAGILNGTCTIQEKLDGSNISIFLDDSGNITTASRNQIITEGFNGFIDYVKNHEGIKKFFMVYPNRRLYGEWLVPHTINYNSLSYKKIYLFDIEDEDGNWLPQHLVETVASNYSLNYPQVFATIDNPTEEDINQFVGKTSLGAEGEGVVIKNLDFVNQFGDSCYAKITTQKFKEDNATVFGNNNKDSESYWEQYVVNKYCTLARVEKILNKIQPMINEPLSYQHTSRVVGTCYHDMITEECFEIAKKVDKISFKKLQHLANKKFTTIYKDILGGVNVQEKY